MAGTKKSKKPRKKLDQQQQIPESVAQRLRAIRQDRGHSSYEVFAYENDFSRSQYGAYERGADMRLSTFIRICKALNVTPEEFFKGLKF